MRLVRPRTAGVLLAVVLVLTGCSTTRSSAPRTLPDVTLAPFSTGSPLKLADLRGPAVLNVWASWCAPCRKELPLYQQYAEQQRGKVAVVGIDFQDTRRDLARQLVRQTGVTYPLYADPDGRVGARVLPQLILVDAKGRVVHREGVEITSVAQLDALVRQHLEVGS